MQNQDLSRRGFSRLTTAAFGGLLAGTGAAVVADEKKEDKPKLTVDPALLLQDPNTCRGLNTCSGKGKGKHECAGLGSCATAKAHTCGGENECKGQGGCGGYPGQNTCKSKGHCAVPLSDKTWKLARMQFEHLMKDAGKKFGDAPKKG